MANQNGDWATACRDLGQALTKCADDSVPHLRELKSGCATEIMRYRSCLDKHGDQPDDVVGDKCGDLLKAVWTCSERVMANINNKKDPAASPGLGLGAGTTQDSIHAVSGRVEPDSNAARLV